MLQLWRSLLNLDVLTMRSASRTRKHEILRSLDGHGVTLRTLSLDAVSGYMNGAAS